MRCSDTLPQPRRMNMHAGRGNFAIHSAPNDLNIVLGRDAALFYFMDINVARVRGEVRVWGLQW